MRGAVAIRTNLRFGSVSDNSRDVGQYFKNPIVVSSYTVDRKLVAVPHHAYIGLLFYRTDLLQRYGYRRPPKTWNELESMANRIQTGERARGVKDFWGYVWQGAAT